MDFLTAILILTAAALGLLLGLLRVRRRVLAEDAAIAARIDKLARLREENQRRFAGAPPLNYRAMAEAWEAESPWPPSPPPRATPPRFGDQRRRSHLTAVR